MEKQILKLMKCFKESFITGRNEIILDKKHNIYFRLEDVKNELDLKCKIFEWLSRPAHKGIPERTQKKILEGVNKFLETTFTKGDMDEIYCNVGNNCNRELCIQFVESGYDFNLLPRKRDKDVE